MSILGHDQDPTNPSRLIVNEFGTACTHGLAYLNFPYGNVSLTIVNGRGQLQFASGRAIDLECSEL